MGGRVHSRGTDALTSPRHEARTPTTRIFPGWWIVGNGAAIQMLIGGLIYQLYGAYVVLLEREFGWSKTTLATVYSLFRVESGLLGPPQGWLLDRYGPRPVMRVGMVLLGVGFIALSQIDRLLTLFLSFLVIAVGATLAGYVSICVAVVRWFDRKMARALSIVSMGSAIGGLLVPTAVLALERWGWRATAFASGLLFLTAGSLLTWPFWSRPEQRGWTVDGIDPGPLTANLDEAEPDFTATQAMTSPAFWTLSLGHASAVVLVSAVSVHLIPHLTESLGFTLREAGFAVMVMTTVQIGGLALGGYLGDRLNRRQVAIICMFMHSAAFLCLAFARSWVLVTGFAVLHGVAWGGRAPLMQALRADYFGRRAYGTIVGYSSIIVTVGTISGPILIAWLFTWLGGYRPAFGVVSIFGLIGAAMFWMARPPRQDS